MNFSGPRGETLYAVTPTEYRSRLPSAQEYLVQMETERRLLAALTADEAFDSIPMHRPISFPRPQDL